MAVTHISSNTQDSASALSLTFTVPTHTTDDLLICFVKQSENTSQRTWDDDGGGGNGWTREVYNRTTGGRDMEIAIYWKFATSASETNPTFTWASGITAEPMSGMMEVYRGVDQVVPFGTSGIKYAEAQNDANPPNPSINIDYINTMVVCFHGATHDDISAVAAPTGFTLRSQVWNGTSDDHRNVFSADLEVDTLGNYTPPDWQHTVLNNTPEYQTYTVGLVEAQPIHVTGGTALDDFNWGDTGLTITGDGFESTQGIGKVEFWSDISGTVKTVQTISSWASDVSITIDTVQGSLSNDTAVYLVITNNSGDVSSAVEVNVGILPYTGFLSTLNPDHFWKLNNTYDDTGASAIDRPMTSSIVGTHIFLTDQLAEDTTHSWRLNDVLDKREILDSSNMNVTISSKERTLMAWIQLQGTQKSLSVIWKEGGGIQNLALLVGVGNVLMWQLADVAGSRDNVQAYSNFRLVPGRTYCILGRYSHLDTIKESRLYIDGIKQDVTDGNPMTTGIFDSHSGDIVWGNADNNLEMGTVDINFAGQEECWSSHWGTWSDNSPNATAGGLSDTEIYGIFERGAIAELVIASGTESAMQTALDAISDTTRSNTPLAIRIERVTGGGSLELVADNINFDNAGSLDIQWMGVSGEVLTWVNSNGASINANKTSSFVGGSIVIEEDVSVKITVKDFDDSTAVENARIRLTADTGGDLTEGVVISEGLTDSSGVLTTSLRYTSDQPVTGRVRRSTSGTLYKEAPISSSISANGLDIEIFLINDE